MQLSKIKWYWLPAVVFAAVVGSLGVVWALSQFTGMSYNPAIVGGVSGGIAAAMFFGSCGCCNK